MDYSSKYGLGYILSNSFIGVYFNDNSKMIQQKNENEVKYIYKVQKVNAQSGQLTREELRETIGLQDIPE